VPNADTRLSTGRLLAGVALISLLAPVALLFLDKPLARFCWSLGPAVRAAAGVLSAPASLPVALVAAVVLMVASCINVRVRNRTLRSELASIHLVGTIILSWGTSQSLKAVFGRARPGLLVEHGIYGFRFFTRDHDFSSFPSGHAAFAFGVATALSFVGPRHRPALLAAATVVALSRVLAGAHYLSDVLVGAALGSLVALAALRLLRRHGFEPLPGR